LQLSALKSSNKPETIKTSKFQHLREILFGSQLFIELQSGSSGIYALCQSLTGSIAPLWTFLKWEERTLQNGWRIVRKKRKK
jgi:hypothetical protein